MRYPHYDGEFDKRTYAKSDLKNTMAVFDEPQCEEVFIQEHFQLIVIK